MTIQTLKAGRQRVQRPGLGRPPRRLEMPSFGLPNRQNKVKQAQTNPNKVKILFKAETGANQFVAGSRLDWVMPTGTRSGPQIVWHPFSSAGRRMDSAPVAGSLTPGYPAKKPLMMIKGLHNLLNLRVFALIPAFSPYPRPGMRILVRFAFPKLICPKFLGGCQKLICAL